MSELNSFANLRRKIRQAGKQYRRSNDNSESLFHPEGGFVYAYSIPEVEEALSDYEETLPKEQQTVKPPALALEDEVVKRATEICNNHTSMEARDFARTVLGFIALKNKADSRPCLKLLDTEKLEPKETEPEVSSK